MIHDLARGIDGLIIVAIYGENPGATPDKARKEKPLVLQFAVGKVDETFKAIMAFEGRPHLNVYMPLAVMRRSLPPRQKGSEKDVVAVLGLVLDSDDDAGRPTRPPIEPNYVLETSSHPARNQQEFLLFDRPLS